jgi:uncharacterized protein
MDISFPYRFDSNGRTAEDNEKRHIQNLIAQVLFTSPGERPNRPTFGSGLLRTVFEPTSNDLAAALQTSVQGALQQWLGDRIVVNEVRIESNGNVLYITVRYVIRRTLQPDTANFQFP